MQDNFINKPQAIEAEQYIIGCMLIYPELVEDILSQLRGDDFADAKNKIIFEALSISSVVVCQRPKDLPQPPNCGIIAVLMGGARGHRGRQTGMYLRAETPGLRAWSSHIGPSCL